MSDSIKSTRRDFLHTTAAAGAVGMAAPYFVSASALAQPGKPGPNDKINIGLIIGSIFSPCHWGIFSF